jgi:hypothetical protein
MFVPALFAVGVILSVLAGTVPVWLIRAGHDAFLAILVSTVFDVAGLALQVTGIVLTTRAVNRGPR